MDEKKKKILIVDDDTFLLDMYAFKFSKADFDVYSAHNADLALSKLRDGLQPDIILTDIIMPNMDGFEMLEKINTEKLSVDSIKIILSNKGQQEDIDRGMSLGASGYIIKVNSTPVEVIDKVVAILKDKMLIKNNPEVKSK